MTDQTRIQYEAKKCRDGTVRIVLNVLPPRPAGNEFTNQCCTPLLQLIRANQDMKVVTDYQQVLQYLLKYVTKSEKSSNHMDAVNNIADQKTDMSEKSFLLTLASKNLSSRDQSSQEVAINIDKRELYWSDLNFVSLSLGDRAKVFRNDLRNPPQTKW